MTDRRLLVIDQAPVDTGACCGACATTAAEEAGIAASPKDLLIELDRTRTRPLEARRPISRDADRRITFGGLIVAVGFVAVAVLVTVVGAARGGAAWLPLHLALAGGAGTAVSAVLPFFTTALAVAAPAGPRARIAAIGLVASGAAVVSASVASGDAFLGHLGGSIYLAGILGVMAVAFHPLRRSLGPRRRRVEAAYAAALIQVAVSVTIATVFLAGWEPVVQRWAMLKPAHAWLNIVGFLSLVVVATLIHLAPTVEGTRIRPRRSATVALVGIAVGVPLIALGYAVGADVIARIGALAALIAAVAVPIHAVEIARDRSHWTTDLGWHRFTTGSLRAASGWFAAALLVAAGRVVWLGADPVAWSLELIAAPLAIGWVIQTLIAAWSHLLPAIGPGNQVAHAAQRSILGRLARTRLVGLNGGLALLWAGLALDVPIASVGGGAAVVAVIGGATALAATAARSRLARR